jgi:hypothetical protein
MARIHWENVGTLDSRVYTCGYCGNSIASEKGWRAKVSSGQTAGLIHVCHRCDGPTYFSQAGAQTPGVVFGQPVADVVDESVAALYAEARKATGATCYTAAVLACRKLLMHIAVAKGAKAGESFVSYVEYLAANNYVPPDARGWVDHIRAKGNEANHEISIMGSTEAEDLLAFCEMLLKLIYEFPAVVRRRAAGSPEPAA